jgi:hypothetical protein
MTEVIKRLGEVQPGEKFRYIGSIEDDWHVVIESSEDKVVYTCGHKNETNRSPSVKVLVKAKSMNSKRIAIA